MIIDFHTHSFAPKVAERAVSAIEKSSGYTPYTRGLVDQLENRMDEWGVDRACVLPIATKPTQQRVINDWAAELKNSSSRMIPFGTVHPEADDLGDELQRIKELGLYGVKLHPDYQRFMADDPVLDEMYGLIEETGLPVILHAGWDCYSPNLIHCSPERARKLKLRHPKLKLVLAHLGGNDQWEQVRDLLAGLDGELYFDTSFTAKCPDALMTEIIKKHGSDRILFGSDCPWESAAKMAEKLLRLDITDNDRDRIFGLNAERLLSLA